MQAASVASVMDQPPGAVGHENVCAFRVGRWSQVQRDSFIFLSGPPAARKRVRVFRCWQIKGVSAMKGWGLEYLLMSGN